MNTKQALIALQRPEQGRTLNTLLAAVEQATAALTTQGQTNEQGRAADGAVPFMVTNPELASRSVPSSASPVAVPEMSAVNFACYLIDHCERDVVYEESVQRWLAMAMVNPRYNTTVSALPDAGLDSQKGAS